MDTYGYPTASNSLVCENSVWLMDCVCSDVCCIDGNAQPQPKSMLVSWKLVASARSWTKAVDDALCTMFGKPHEIGLS